MINNCGMQPLQIAMFDSQRVYIYIIISFDTGSDHVHQQVAVLRTIHHITMQEEAPFFNAQIGVQKKPSNIIQQNSKSSNKIPNHPTSPKNTSIIRIYKIYKPEQTNSHTPTSLSVIKGPPHIRVSDGHSARSSQRSTASTQPWAVAPRLRSGNSQDISSSFGEPPGIGLGRLEVTFAIYIYFCHVFFCWSHFISWHILSMFYHVLSYLLIPYDGLVADCWAILYDWCVMRVFFSSNRSKPCFSISVGLVYLQTVLFGEHIPRVFFHWFSP